MSGVPISGAAEAKAAPDSPTTEGGSDHRCGHSAFRGLTNHGTMIGDARVGRAVTIFVEEESFFASDDRGQLIDLLDHPSLRVRAAAFEAVTRLPLERTEWSRVGDYAMQALDQTRRLMEDERFSGVRCGCRYAASGGGCGRSPWTRPMPVCRRMHARRWHMSFTKARTDIATSPCPRREHPAHPDSLARPWRTERTLAG